MAQAHPELIERLALMNAPEETFGQVRVELMVKNAPFPLNTPVSTQDTNGVKPIFSAINVPTTDENFASPPDVVQDKILFIVNNLSFDNQSVKVEESKQVLPGTFFPTFRIVFPVVQQLHSNQTSEH